MWGTLLLIYSMKKEAHFIVCFLQEGAARTELTANITTKFLQFRIVKVSIKQKIYLVGLDSAQCDKI